MMMRFVVTSSCSISLDVALHLSVLDDLGACNASLPYASSATAKAAPIGCGRGMPSPPTPAVSCVRQPFTLGEDLPAPVPGADRARGLQRRACRGRGGSI